MRTLILLLAGFFFVSPADAAPRTSANYNVAAETLDAGGTKQTSANYSNDASLGGVGGISTAATPAETAKHGYIGQLYEVTAVSLTATPASLNEAGSRQIVGNANLDDGTSLTGSTLAWSVLSGPIVSITPNGLATAGFVYQNTPATVRGQAQGKSGTLVLTVLNVGNDDFGSYAGDGLPDDWQVQYFGLNNPNAGPTRDPDSDGQNNFFEYTAGTDPTNGLSRFNLSLAFVPGQPDQKRIIFSPRLSTRTYAVEYRTNLVTGTPGPLTGTTTSDSGAERTVIDLNATNRARFYRVQITNP